MFPPKRAPLACQGKSTAAQQPLATFYRICTALPGRRLVVACSTPTALGRMFGESPMRSDHFAVRRWISPAETLL